MNGWYNTGWNDAKRGTFYADSLPHGTDAQSKTRVMYRSGWTANRATRGIESLPACVMSVGNRHYWLVDVEGMTPVFNVTDGSTPSGKAGYRDLPALLQLKGDYFA